MSILSKIPARYRKYAYDLVLAGLAAAYAHGFITEGQLNSWQELVGLAVAALARFNVSE